MPRMTPPDQSMPPGPDPGTAEGRARSVVLLAATRTVRKELAAIQKWAPRYAGNPVGWREWVADFYGRHVALLGEALGLDEKAARHYGAAHTAALLEHGLSIVEEWDHHAPAALTALALGEDVAWDSITPAS